MKNNLERIADKCRQGSISAYRDLYRIILSGNNYIPNTSKYVNKDLYSTVSDKTRGYSITSL